MDDITTTKTDETFFQNGKEYSIEEYLLGIDDVLETIAETGDFEIGINTVRSMTTAAHAVGIGLAKLLWGLKRLWDSNTDFFEYISQFTPITRLTASRYIDAWDGYLQVPDTYKPEFITMPMKNMNALGAAISQGFVVENDEWEKLAATSNNTEFLQVLREDVKECAPRKNSIVIYLEENGDLVSWCAGERVQIGYLDVSDLDNHPIMEKSINRIVNSAGIVRR